MKMKPFVILLALSLSLGLVTGCATSKTELKSQTDRMETWEVNASSEKTFRAYKDFAEEKYSGGDFLWSGGLRVKAYYYGPDAEVSIKMEGNPFARITFAHLDLGGSSDKTIVKVWSYNGPWKRNLDELKKLLPTRVLSTP